MRSRLAHWLRRYGPAEILGTITALLGSFAVFRITRNSVAAAYGGALGENLGFYGLMVARQIIHDRRREPRHALRAVGRTMLRLLGEFGPAEALDSFLIRPLAMGLATRKLGRSVGIIVGKLAADITFYLPVIASYEFQRWKEKRGPNG